MSEYENNSVYKGTVAAQALNKSDKDGKLKLSLKVKLTHRLKNRFDPKSAVTLPESEQHTKALTLNVDKTSNKPAAYERSMKELKAYGMPGKAGEEDVLLLHTDHPKAFLLAGKEVLLRCWVKDGEDGSPDVMWFLQVPERKNMDLKEAMAYVAEAHRSDNGTATDDEQAW